MVGLGLTQIEVANLIGISDRTLRKCYAAELRDGVAEANLRVSQALFANATKHNNVAAQIWWSKCRMGWKEATDLNVAGQGGGPITYEFCWRETDTAAAQAPKPASPPTIDATADEAGDAGTLVTWAGGKD